MSVGRRSAAVLALAIVAACTPGPERSPALTPQPAPTPAGAGALDRELLASRIGRYFESSGQISPDVESEIIDVEPAEIPRVGELRRVTVRLSTEDQEQEIDFLVSADGRWFLTSDPVDLSVDPVARVIDAISIGPDDPYLGAEGAPVTIVEYSDFQCPFCARAESIVKDDVLAEYGDRVRLVYKQMPLVSVHPWAQAASEIGLCVLRLAGNDAYWKYHARVFAAQRAVRVETAAEQLVAMAGEAGAEPDGVERCFEAEETTSVVLATLEEAEGLGIKSTPTFFINGRRLSGAQPSDAFKAIIDPELGAARPDQERRSSP